MILPLLLAMSQAAAAPAAPPPAPTAQSLAKAANRAGNAWAECAVFFKNNGPDSGDLPENLARRAVDSCSNEMRRYREALTREEQFSAWEDTVDARYDKTRNSLIRQIAALYAADAAP